MAEAGVWGRLRLQLIAMVPTVPRVPTAPELPKVPETGIGPSLQPASAIQLSQHLLTVPLAVSPWVWWPQLGAVS